MTEIQRLLIISCIGTPGVQVGIRENIVQAETTPLSPFQRRALDAGVRPDIIERGPTNLRPGVRSAIVVGGGFIGLEMAENLRHLGSKVDLVDIFPSIPGKRTPTTSEQEKFILDNISWNMRKHIETSIAMKFGYFVSAPNDLRTKQPFRKIILPLLRIKYAVRDIDLKDIHLFVDDPEKQHLSFLIKKYHDDVFATENDVDAFIDKALEQAIDTIVS